MQHVVHDYAESELAYKRFLEPAIRTALQSLKLPIGAKILDAGCGPGATLALLLEHGPAGQVIGIDASASHLRAARLQIVQHALTSRVIVQEADLFAQLPFAKGSFDAVWVSDVLFPDDTGDQAHNIVARLCDLLKPNGKLAIFYGNWLRLMLLPGHSQLEHFISIANERRRSTLRTWANNLHPECASTWLRRAGCSSVIVSSQTAIYGSPLSPHVHNYLQWHLEHIYGRIIAHRDEGFAIPDCVVEEWMSISDPRSPNYILDRSDYFCAAHPLLVVGTKYGGSSVGE
jgi:SAM-dependent methyltransferase